jgi:hypothetical protein
MNSIISTVYNGKLSNGTLWLNAYLFENKKKKRMSQAKKVDHYISTVLKRVTKQKQTDKHSHALTQAQKIIWNTIYTNDEIL